MEGASPPGCWTLGWVLAGALLGFAVGVAAWVVLTVWLVRRPGAHNGQTFGKQILGIRAICAGQTEIGLGRSLLRKLVAKGVLVGLTSAAVSALLGLLDAAAIGFAIAALIWCSPAFFDEQRRALQDRLAGTRVIEARNRPQPVAVGDEQLWPASL